MHVDSSRLGGLERALTYQQRIKDGSRLYAFNHTRRQNIVGGIGAIHARQVSDLPPVVALKQAWIPDQLENYMVYLERRLNGLNSLQPPTFVEAGGRIVAVGDLHGDIYKAVSVLQSSGVMQVKRGQPVWVGGNTVVVQVGDIFDRGDDEMGILLLFRELDRQARRSGGACFVMNGNHEALNVTGTFRYVTPGAFRETGIIGGVNMLSATPDELISARQHLVKPGGPIARDLALNPTVLVVNDTAFAHGGLLPIHVEYGVQRINAEVAEWMRGEEVDGAGSAKPPFHAMATPQSVMWNRLYGNEQWTSMFEQRQVCAVLRAALEGLGARRLVVGHTPQVYRGLNCECDGMVWRVDVGMSSGVLNSQVEFLEILPPDTTTTTTILADDGGNGGSAQNGRGPPIIRKFVEGEGYAEAEVKPSTKMVQLSAILGSWV